jgi:hypothetical protein
MAKTLDNIADIVRKVAARKDQSILDATIFGYINDFYQLEMGQDLRLFDERSFYEFDTVASTDEYSVDMDATTGIGYSLLSGPAWVDGFTVQFHISPQTFFAQWPETQTYTEQRPTDILWYDNTLTFRGPPDDAYSVKITSYKINSTIDEASDEIAEDYWFRYIAYGAALDILADAGEFEKVGQVMPMFERYKDLVNARNYSQMQSKIAIRNF